MAHMSEDCRRLALKVTEITSLDRLAVSSDSERPDVYLLRFPTGRSDEDAACSMSAFSSIAEFCAGLNKNAVVCILTSPPDAARLLTSLGNSLRFQLWVAVKTASSSVLPQTRTLPQRHAALLIHTRYKESLRHTKTRVQYTYCPACGKTTKDYGGKKHVYHEYGTLLSDVWRDIAIEPDHSIEPMLDRLRDLFGLESHRMLHVLDMRSCAELAPQPSITQVCESRLSMEWESPVIPLGSQLVNGDCLDTLRSLPDNSVDFCFADPPYNIEKIYDHWNDALESIEYFSWCDKWLSELARVLKPGRTLAVVNIPLWAVRHYQHLCSLLRFQNWIAWDALSFPVRMIMPAHYSVLCFSKGQPRPLPGLDRAKLSRMEEEALAPLEEFYCLRASCVAWRRKNGLSDIGNISDVWYDIHRLKHNSRRVDHPCQLPPMLMRRLFALFTEPEEMILDCFNGAGTSTLAAQQMNRRYIGIELSPQYHALALARHEQLARGEDPFGKQEEVPKAKNSRVERLAKQRYAVSKKALQLDVRRIAHQLGHLPSREEVTAWSKYPIEYFDRYFISWGEVCAAARTTGMSELPPDTRHEERQLRLSLEGD
jgi:DNA modification methylase